MQLSNLRVYILYCLFLIWNHVICLWFDPLSSLFIFFFGFSRKKQTIRFLIPFLTRVGGFNELLLDLFFFLLWIPRSLPFFLFLSFPSQRSRVGKTLNRHIDLVLYSQFFFFKKEKTKKEKIKNIKNKNRVTVLFCVYIHATLLFLTQFHKSVCPFYVRTHLL